MFASGFLCPTFLLWYLLQPMVKSQSYWFFTWMSNIAHQNHFPCFTSTFEHWLSVCGNNFNILTVICGAKYLVIFSARMRCRGYYSSFYPSWQSCKQDAVYLSSPKLLPPITGGVAILATYYPKLTVHDSPLKTDMGKYNKYTIWIPKSRNIKS